MSPSVRQVAYMPLGHVTWDAGSSGPRVLVSLKGRLNWPVYQATVGRQAQDKLHIRTSSRCGVVIAGACEAAGYGVVVLPQN